MKVMFTLYVVVIAAGLLLMLWAGVRHGMRTFLRNNSLGLFFGGLFLVTLVGQSFAGWHSFNDEHRGEGLATIGYGDYVTSTDFAVAVAENWQSEFLQFLLYVLATVWFLQQGSPESKELDKPGSESDEGPAGRSARPGRLAGVGAGRRLAHDPLLALARPGGGRDLPALVARAGRRRLGRRERAPHRAAPRPAVVGRLRRFGGLLGAHPAELAVGVPRGRRLRGAGDLPAGAGLAPRASRSASPTAAPASRADPPGVVLLSGAGRRASRRMSPCRHCWMEGSRALGKEPARPLPRRKGEGDGRYLRRIQCTPTCRRGCRFRLPRARRALRSRSARRTPDDAAVPDPGDPGGPRTGGAVRRHRADGAADAVPARPEAGHGARAGPGDRDVQPEGWRRQDHDDHQPGRGARGVRPQGAAGRLRPAGLAVGGSA